MDSLDIFKLGLKARQDGNSESANPFKYGTKEYAYWWDGWMERDSFEEKFP